MQLRAIAILLTVFLPRSLPSTVWPNHAVYSTMSSLSATILGLQYCEACVTPDAQDSTYIFLNYTRYLTGANDKLITTAEKVDT
jgi:hypothetical protein